MSEGKKFGMRVDALLDKTTIVVAGEGIEDLTEGTTLLILAVGQRPTSRGISAPLVIPKAEVVVDRVTKFYALARTTTYEATVETGIAVMASGTKKVLRRRELKVDEKQLIGNPALLAVAVGDPVIREYDYSEYVEHLGREAE